MTCTICGKPEWHGSQLAQAGTYLAETGCHAGVMMDDDLHAEGWSAKTVYPPCPNNPKCCARCGGCGETQGGDCPTCGGTGWIGPVEWPIRSEEL